MNEYLFAEKLQDLRDNLSDAIHRRICEGDRKWCLEDNGDCERAALVSMPIIGAVLPVLMDALTTEKAELAAELIKEKRNISIIRELRSTVDELQAERDELKKVWTDFSSKIGYGDDVTEPAITPEELVQVWCDQDMEAKLDWEELQSVQAERNALREELERYKQGQDWAALREDIRAFMDSQAKLAEERRTGFIEGWNTALKELNAIGS